MMQKEGLGNLAPTGYIGGKRGRLILFFYQNFVVFLNLKRNFDCKILYV